MNALKRRAQARLNDQSIDPQSPAILRYALEINDPWLAELVRRAEAGEAVGDSLDFEETSETNNEDASAEKIETLTELSVVLATSRESNLLPCSCSWRQLKTRRTRKHSRTP
jgi:hypothetical protein